MAEVLDRNDDITTNVRNALSSIHERFGDSKALHELGVNDKIASDIQNFFTDPLSALIQSNTASLGALRKLAQRLFLNFLGTQSDSIIKAFNVDVESGLSYYICIKDDSSDNREPFFEFMDIYDELGLRTLLPLQVKFVPERVLGKVDLTPLEIC